MKQIKKMSQIELAAYIQFHLQKDGINVVLSGGSAGCFSGRKSKCGFEGNQTLVKS
jgi:hypothetical protein